MIKAYKVRKTRVVSGGKGNLIVVIMIISMIKIILIIITMTVTAVTTADKNYDKKTLFIIDSRTSSKTNKQTKTLYVY